MLCTPLLTLVLYGRHVLLGATVRLSHYAVHTRLRRVPRTHCAKGAAGARVFDMICEGGRASALTHDVPIIQVVQEAHNALFFNHGQCCAAGAHMTCSADQPAPMCLFAVQHHLMLPSSTLRAAMNVKPTKASMLCDGGSACFPVSPPDAKTMLTDQAWRVCCRQCRRWSNVASLRTCVGRDAYTTRRIHENGCSSFLSS